MSNFQLNVKVNGVEQSVSTIGELESALKATKEELKGLEVGSEAFEELAKQARVLQDELKGSFKEATNFDKSLGQLTESVSRLGSSVAAGFSIATAAIGIFGGDAEELTRAQVKAQQALAIAFGATAIATNAAKLAGDVKLVTDRLQLGITNLLTTAFGKETISKSASAAATGTATIAQRALNAAMAANPVLLLVGALGLLVGALVAFGGETKKSISFQEDFNRELARTTDAIDREIKRQRDLIRIQGQVLENSATNETERLRIRQETQKKLNELDIQELDNKIGSLNAQLDEEKKSLDLSLITAKFYYEQQKTLQDRNIEGTLDAETQKQIGIIRAYENGFITIDEYYQSLFKLQEEAIKNSKFETEEERKAAQERLNSRKDLQFQINQLGEDRKTQLKVQSEQERLNAQQIAKTEADNLRQRKQQQVEYNKDIIELSKRRVKALQDLERQLTDFQNERLSEVTSTFEFEGKTFTFTNEDIIAGYDERITKIEESKKRAIEDAQEAFEEEVRRFQETERKRVDANGRRVVDEDKIKEDIRKLNIEFEAEQLKREEVFDKKIIAIREDRKNKIQEIEDILVNEIAFGDNSLLDNRQSLLLEAVDFELQQSQRRIEIERGFNVQLIRERQNLEAQKRVLLKKSLEEQLRIETFEALKNVQGREDQKAKQREELTKLYNDRLARINEDFRNQEEAAEKQSAQEILNYKLQKLQEFSALAFQGFNQVIALFQSLNELAAVERENSLRDLRDVTAQQTSILNEAYNQDLANLEARYAAGLVTQDQYNNSVQSLQQNLNSSTKQLQDKQAKEELKAKKEAFEQEKKLKIASTIISGIQGALQAFAGAFTLGPIAGPIVGGILAGLVATTTAVQVAAISKTKFDAGAPSITGANSPSGGGGSPASNFGSSGGSTQFSNDLIGTPRPNDGSDTTDGRDGSQGMRVYVLESDITSTQQRVSVAESSATFG